MAWNNNREGIAAIGSAYGAARSRFAYLLGDLAISEGLSERDRLQRTPYILLKRRTTQVEWEFEVFALPCEVLLQLPLGLKQDALILVLYQFSERDTPRMIVLPQDRNETCFTRDECKFPNG